VRRVLLFGALLVATVPALVAWAWLRAQTVDLSRLEREIPTRTAMMVQREREAKRARRAFRVDQRPVPYSRISPLLRRAVLVAEDDRFFSHGGLDWEEIRESARKNVEKRRVVRGGSTITQQLARNLYLSSARSPLRKLEEVFLARRLERSLSKRRIFELYLNVIEWGDGIYGAEAASRRWFGVSAAGLSERQAVLLAAVIINPRRYSPSDPSRRIQNRARMIASRLHRRGALDDDGWRRARGEPPAPPAPGADTGGALPDSAESPEPAPAVSAPESLLHEP
jgi:monofunctional biosynthetic peptidoglycan transglycosylase